MLNPAMMFVLMNAIMMGMAICFNKTSRGATSYVRQLAVRTFDVAASTAVGWQSTLNDN